MAYTGSSAILFWLRKQKCRHLTVCRNQGETFCIFDSFSTKMDEAIIIGAGPAGLTAAYELLTTTDIKPVIIEEDNQVGGLSKTINYKGNRIDLGGHRFFSKSEKVVNWWLHFLPLAQPVYANQLDIHYHNQKATLSSSEYTATGDKVMLIRPRKSRIYYDHRFYDYPLRINRNTIKNLGAKRLVQLMGSYVKAKLLPVKPEDSLEAFFINRFGSELYQTFFKAYTEKVWGIACDKIPATWGHQRVKDLNVSKVLWDAFRSVFRRNTSVNQKGKSTSLIEQFLYPKYGPGQLWEAVADEIKKRGGEILLNTTVEQITCSSDHSIKSVAIRNNKTGAVEERSATFFLSSMPVRTFINNLSGCSVPSQVATVANGLEYRDYLIVGILVKEVRQEKDRVTDNWIYLQDKRIKAGRLQLFHNWSPDMVADPANGWLGVEYFCNEGDSFWQLRDEQIREKAINEMCEIGLINRNDVLDATVIRVKKAYPSYYGMFDRFGEVQTYLNGFRNLFVIGRNGMHRYNNADHSMLTAMAVVEAIRSGSSDKAGIWEINTEMEYHEKR